jgi:hypothetical protein
MNTTHTQGPWWFTATEEEGYYVAGAGDKELTNLISREDARLIASAPDLLAALKAITCTYRTFRNVPKDEQEWTSTDDEALDNAFAVLARARGTA